MNIRTCGWDVAAGEARVNRLQATLQVLAGAAAYVEDFEHKQEVCRVFYQVCLLPAHTSLTYDAELCVPQTVATHPAGHVDWQVNAVQRYVHKWLLLHMLLFQANVTTHHAWWKGLTLHLLRYVGLVANTALDCMQAHNCKQETGCWLCTRCFSMLSGSSKCKRAATTVCQCRGICMPSNPKSRRHSKSCMTSHSSHSSCC